MEVIRRFTRVHCKRGPARCERCREIHAVKPALLKVVTSGPPAARRVIEIDGAHHEIEVVRWFDTDEEAHAYAQEHGTRVEL